MVPFSIATATRGRRAPAAARRSGWAALARTRRFRYRRGVDLSRRSGGTYRGAAIRCPGCGEPMTIVPLAEADVDVCASCQGIWIDWFDGEVGDVARDVLAVTAHTPVSSSASSMRNESRAVGGCPRCNGVQLVAERYVLKKQPAFGKAETQETGAELLRCEHCAGSFVSATSASLLGTLPADADPPPSESAKALEPLPWQKFVAVLKALFGKR